MPNRYGLIRDTIADVTTGTSDLRKTALAYTYLAQDYQPTATKSITIIRCRLLKTGTPTGNLFLRFYAAGATPGAGTLLGTTYNVDVTTLGTGYSFFTLQTPVAVTAGQQYYAVLDGDYTISASNYFSWYRTTSSSYANGSGWSHNGSTWTQQPTWDFSIAFYDNTDGGSFDIDSDGSGAGGKVTLSDLTSYKGGVAPAQSDMIYVYNGKTLWQQDGETWYYKQIVKGTSSTGVAPSGQRYGILKTDGGATLVHLGDATATNSGIYASPTTPGTESKGCKWIRDLSNNKHIVITNSVGSLNTSYRHCANFVYGNIETIMGSDTTKQVQWNYTYTSPYVAIACDSSKANSGNSINRSANTPLGATAVSLINLPGVNIDLPQDFRFCTYNPGSFTQGYFCTGTTASITSSGSIDMTGCSITGSWTTPVVMLQLRGLISDVYAAQFKVSGADIRPTQIVPTISALTALGDGTFKVEISNIASYAQTDMIVIYDSADNRLGRFTRQMYETAGASTVGIQRKPANCGIISCATLSALTGIYARASSDNATFSEKSATASVTPTFNPAVTDVVSGITYGLSGEFTGTRNVDPLPSPSALSIIQKYAVNSKAIYIRWTPSAMYATYQVYVNGSPYGSALTSVDELNIIGLTPNTQYSIYVKATNNTGSTNSAIVYVTTPALNVMSGADTSTTQDRSIVIDNTDSYLSRGYYNQVGKSVQIILTALDGTNGCDPMLISNIEAIVDEFKGTFT